MKVNSLYFLEENQNKFLLEYFLQIFQGINVYNTFNPSFFISKEIKATSFRAISLEDKSKELSSYFCIDDGGGPNIYDLSKEWTSYLNCPRLIDPKIFCLNKDVYITFNSGYVKSGNDIFIMKIYPNIESPKRVVYNKRKNQERNWSFFVYEDNIYALYWINPLTILKLEEQSENEWKFITFYKQKLNGIYNDITIGTQLCYFNNNYYFIGHKKQKINKKKIYLGKLFSFNFMNRNINSESEWMAHSFDSLFGDKIKHNNNLFSCTYFSGLGFLEDKLITGYGVNDISIGFYSIL